MEKLILQEEFIDTRLKLTEETDNSTIIISDDEAKQLNAAIEQEDNKNNSNTTTPEQQNKTEQKPDNKPEPDKKEEEDDAKETMTKDWDIRFQNASAGGSVRDRNGKIITDQDKIEKEYAKLVDEYFNDKSVWGNVPKKVLISNEYIILEICRQLGHYPIGYSGKGYGANAILAYLVQIGESCTTNILKNIARLYENNSLAAPMDSKEINYFKVKSKRYTDPSTGDVVVDKDKVEVKPGDWYRKTPQNLLFNIRLMNSAYSIVEKYMECYKKALAKPAIDYDFMVALFSRTGAPLGTCSLSPLPGIEHTLETVFGVTIEQTKKEYVFEEIYNELEKEKISIADAITFIVTTLKIAGEEEKVDKIAKMEHMADVIKDATVYRTNETTYGDFLLKAGKIFKKYKMTNNEEKFIAEAIKKATDGSKK